KLYQNPTTYI
nr:Chain C, 10-meric peptide from Hemagglutinin [Influenza A virus (A/Anhui/1/2005(H5N1))]3MGT_F Chain F, 10-meric peptide from Hemagglutinin [Influenza A virus (A/Anhui/1/2005(H5N1))]3MGT_I Chain I, 10-meric peptide from Hemagglutinin [Influenza A virus (A/Anhui/1/2005(H5N1))]3MGT_L Chain L, 10-meric peptide from Hemagglutinin [Influenza A virus (A/Anhui/1/2005(H5N1))]